MLPKKKTHKFHSPSRITWRKFRKNPAAMTGLVWIVLSGIAAIFAFWIIPDKTPHANHQHLEIAAHKPGFGIDVLHIPLPEPPLRPSWVRRTFMGTPLGFSTIPLQSHTTSGDTLHYESYGGQPGFAGMPGEINLRESGAFVRNKKFLLGTDRFGRDMLSQLILGARVSLSVGFIAVGISLIIGISLGSLGGYFRGRTDDVIVWLINVIWSVPTLLLAIAITFALGKGFWQVFVAVGLTMWVEVARVVRGQVISAREKEYVEAARALGLPDIRIMLRHILPNIMGPVIVISAANFASAILIEAGLSFLGIGVQPPMPSWGTMIREHYGYIILDKAYLAILPGLSIMLMVLAFMLLGNGLRDALDKTGEGSD